MKWKFSLICLIFFILNAEATVFIIGDSHAWEFYLVPGCYIRQVKDRTMHRLGRDLLEGLNIKSFDVMEKDAVVFTFGEIDVRCHIGKQRDLHHRNVDEIIHTLVDKYMAWIQKNCAQYHRILPIVYSITPPTDCSFNPEVPYYGSLEDRADLTKKMNEALKIACARSKIEFLDVFNIYSDENGALRRDLSDFYGVHIASDHNGPIRDKLYEILEKNGYPLGFL